MLLFPVFLRKGSNFNVHGFKKGGSAKKLVSDKARKLGSFEPSGIPASSPRTMSD
jgi:hypothetical protein